MADDAVQIHVMEGRLAHELDPGHNHPCHPQEDDLVARLQHIGRIEIGQILRPVGPAQRRERPQRRAEPGIEDVRVLFQRATACRTLLRVTGARLRHDRVRALPAVPDRDAVSPPQLARNLPIVDVLHPVQVNPLEVLRHELDPPVLDRLNGRLGEHRLLHEPLLGDPRLDHRTAPITGADRVRVRSHVAYPLLGFEIAE